MNALAEWTGVLLVVVFVIGVLVIAVREIGFPFLRQKRFRLRQAVDIDAWFGRYYPELTSSQRKQVTNVLSILSSILGIEKTKLLPTDRMWPDYCGTFWFRDDTWDRMTTSLGEFVHESIERDLTDTESESYRNWNTLDDLIRSLLSLIASADQSKLNEECRQL